MISRMIGLAGLMVLAPRVAVAQTARASELPSSRPEKSDRVVPADAPANSRKGMWFSVGLGAGAASLHCQICEGEQQTRGTAGYLRAGATVNTRFLVGAEMNGWMRSDQSGSQRVVALTGNAYFYPDPVHAYYVKGGFGVTRYRQRADEENGDGSTGVSTGGFTGQVGAGYEFRVNPRMSFVPYVNLIGTAKGSLFTESEDNTRFERNRLSTKANVLLVQLGVGVTWH